MEQLQYALSGIIFAVLLFFLSTLFPLPRNSGDRKKLPPEAGRAWPMIGHLHLLSAREPTHKTMTKLADVYGPIFTLRLGMKKALIVSSWEIANEIFTTNDRIFASRPKLTASKVLGYDYAMFGLSPYNSHWRRARKIATLELLTNHRLKQFEPTRASEVRSWMKKLYELWAKTKAESGKKVVVEMKNLFANIALNTIFMVVFGKQFSTAFNGHDSEKYQKALGNFFEFVGMFIPADSFPYLRWLDLGGHEKSMKNTAKIIDEMFDKFLEEHMEKRNLGEEVEMKEQDFMDVMICAVKDEEQHFSHDDDSVIKATCLSMILGGFDTTTTSMIWALSLLVNNEETLKKAQLELDEQVGRERRVKESDVKNLSYLQAIVKETLRLYPAAPLLVPHESMEDCTTDGYHIPKGTRLIVNVQKIQRDPLFWDNSSEFRPERFLNIQNNLDVRGQCPQLIPFGNGRRMCPGISFALQIMHLTLANLLHGFRIERPFQELVDMEESIGLTSIKKAPLHVVITPRLSPQLYE